ncbi:uncharacterized protein LOC112568406 isoform X15 [Pomacea canaliculata]|uniref:uncharacterized protein LOC112568406 isoform X15 n=1 Tax=Pomacea canaliculata TaxID=400727 RepID=UPI000D733502|nr:uncharacterized protein LOC112568406 isoform X15 [Pomacea canaliculata]
MISVLFCVASVALNHGFVNRGVSGQTTAIGDIFVRLVNGRSPLEGRVEVRKSVSDPWGTVCDDDWDNNDAGVVCRQLGLGQIGQAVAGATYGQGTGPINLDNVNCTGSETTLANCTARPWATNNCGHGEDAGVKCASNIFVRLVNGSSPLEGRVEVRKTVSDPWGTVCDDGWGNNDAGVVCRQLGFGQIGQAVAAAAYGQGTGPINLSNVSCTGRETTLATCAARPWTTHNCGHHKDAGVKCDIIVRLVNGRSPLEGRVEVRKSVSDPWGTVCDDGWDNNDAVVVCRQLGFGQDVKAVAGAAYGQGTGPINLDSVSCTGSETTLANCTARTWATHNCGHSEDAGVKCDIFVRLVNGSSPLAGRVEVRKSVSDPWGTVCDDGWDNNDANVVCRQLGFGQIGQAVAGAAYGQGTGPINLDDVNCTGSETTLVNCAANSWSTHDCGHQKDAGVKCDIFVRLVNGSSPLEGRVEVRKSVSDPWGTVCDDGWDNNDAGVVCRQLGFGQTGQAVAAAFYGEGTGPINLDNVNCTGSETTLANCTANSWSTHNCGHHKDAGVQCGIFVRLVNGSSPREGRVEVRKSVSDPWGTVCDDDWDDDDANVVCRQLGLGQIGQAVAAAAYGQGTGPINLDNVDCTGSETTLANCTANSWSTHNCGHHKDAGVQCDIFVRLVNGSSPLEGRVEVRKSVSDPWGTVCDDGWDNNDALVVCRQLGFGQAVKAVAAAFYGQGTGPINLHNVNCTGSETTLASCGANSWATHYCNHGEDAGVKCDIFVRLVNGSSPLEGRVEVRKSVSDPWGTVCDDGWDDNDANVVCRQLGFGQIGQAVVGAAYRQGTGPINLDDVHCTGSETTLANCTANSWTTHNCGHHKDAGVKCVIFVRLVNGSSPLEGRVEVRKSVSDPWGTVCDDGWDNNDANVVCRQLGFGQIGQAVAAATYGQGTGPINLHNVHCTGSETTLANCTSRPWATHNCGHSEDAGVKCDMFVRLVNGSSPLEGRVEVRKSVSDPWGTVCDDDWDNNDANVVCRQLGLGQIGQAVAAAAYGQGTGPINLDDVDCTGSETTLANCTANSWATHDCGHSEDAGVKCMSKCLSAQYFDTTRQQCVGCPPGKHQPWPYADLCDPCPAGQYQNISGQTNCVQCPPGHFQSRSGQTSCISCSPGHYQSEAGQLSCNSCPPGQCQSHSGQLSCISCPPGQYQNGSGQLFCNFCPPGQYQSQRGQLSCTFCPPGQYQNLSGQLSCTSCPPGHYQNLSGQLSCTSCPPGQYQNLSGQLSCISCPPGQYQISSGQPSCIACPAGHYQNISGQTKCTPCPTGQYQNTAGQSSCILCPSGQYQAMPGQSSCVACSVGYYQNTSGQNSCIPCVAGQHQNGTGQEVCTLCPVGQFQNASGQDLCTDCPAGWIQKLPGQTSCMPCPPGQHSAGVDTCLPCPQGQHQPQHAQQQCLACPAGQYQDGRGQSTCSTCPHGTTTSSPAATHRDNCTESPAPSATVTVTLTYTLLAVCTDDQAHEVTTHLFTQVQRLDVDGVCVDLACSNVHVTAWCKSYTASVINSEIRFDNLPTELSTPNKSLVPPNELLLQTAIHTNIFDHIPGTVLQKNKIATSSKQTCPPGFVLSENICDIFVRLVNGSSPREGRVEVRKSVSDPWGTVCDDDWDNNDANVVCRQLGFGRTGQAVAASFYGQGTGPINLDNIHCTGSETTLANCGANSWATHNCGHHKDAGIQCDIFVRLVNGSSPREGRVEVRKSVSDPWGTVCDDDWDNNDANVVCRQLGFGQIGQAVAAAFYGQGTGPINLDNVHCTGSETTLPYCGANSWATHDCGHHKDAGVKCDIFVRLFNGSSPREGRVEVKKSVSDPWGTVCDDGWDDMDAGVVCRQLGFGRTGQAVAAAFYGQGTGPSNLDNVHCTGIERTLANCGAMPWATHNCGHHNDAGVKCDIFVRLVNGSSLREGRVEVKKFVSDPWGTVCDDDWDNNDAGVVCRQLGFGRIGQAVSAAFYGQGTGPINLDNVHCTGIERALANCTANSWATHNCGHHKDAGVKCDIFVRLVNGSSPVEGRVEVRKSVSDPWGTVCDDGWDNNDAGVVCRQLGFGHAAQAVAAAFYGQGTGPINLDNVRCTGRETTLANCFANSWATHNCGHHKDAGVKCDIFVRLVNGSSPVEGRVEVRKSVSDPWGTVCDDGWDNNDANVVCRQLGFGQIGQAVAAAFYGQGTGPINLDNVHCTGRETTLANCGANTWSTHDCGHHKDAGVKCDIFVRLVNGSSPREGRVEVRKSVSDPWGTVCDDDWDDNAAGVVCRQLGFGQIGLAVAGAAYGQGTGPVNLDNVHCTGRETTLANCTARPWATHDCGHHKDAGVKCDIFVRLVNGSSPLEGRVEVRKSVSDPWGTVCDDGWDNNDANVVCRQLGFGQIGQAVAAAFYGQGTGPINLDNVHCTGSETTLANCGANSWATHDCGHHKDAGVKCDIFVRLVNERAPREGRVEVRKSVSDPWGTVCDDDWDNNDAVVVCRQLGFGQIGQAVVGGTYGQGTGPINLDNVHCTGSETTLANCFANSWSTHNCGHHKDAGVKCDIFVRLVNGSSPLEGRVEVRKSVSDPWGTVCDDGWENNDAGVVCRQLRFGQTGQAVAAAFYGQGTGPINLDNVNCTGSETTLANCGDNSWSTHNCGHHKDAGVKCDIFVRLVNGSSPREGRVEVRKSVSDPWGTVCDDDWDNNDANVVCRHLGFGRIGQAVAAAFYGQGTGPINLDNVHCTGRETTLANCTANSWATHDCGHHKDAGVKCDIFVRLVNGSLPREGRVEVRKSVSDPWGTVCDDYWDNNDASVVCRQLGFGQTGLAVVADFYGRGTGPINLDSVHCTGSETTLANCRANSWTTHDCDHGEDAGVKCMSSCLTAQYFDTTRQKCVDCPPGKHQPWPYADFCKPCPAGQYQNISGETNCVQCPPGQFQGKSGQKSCTSCPPGQYQSQNGQLSCTSCPPGQYQSQSGQISCITCPPGYYQNRSRQLSCTSCPLGQYQSQSGQLSCTSCPPGQYQSQIGQLSCISCSPGQYQSQRGQLSCTSCPLGHYQNTSGQLSCTSCPLGHYQNKSGQLSCISCSPGQYQSQRGQLSCTFCRPGQYQSQSGQLSCTSCPLGHYQNKSGQLSCISCSPGQYQSQRSKLSCMSCPTGHYQNRSGQLSCITCPPGQYQNGSGQLSCTSCPPGQYQSQSGQPSCTSCPPGQYQSQIGKLSCISCATGQYQNQSGQLSCISCPPGQYQRSSGQSSCSACPAGHYQNISGQTKCDQCPTGQYQNATGQSSCILCRPGQYQAMPGQSSCASCSVGYYQNTSGQNSCIPCVAGQHQNGTGQEVCTLCPVGQFQNASGQDLCTDCPAGWIQKLPGQTSCMPCPPGQHSAGVDTCLPCPQGQHQPQQAQQQCLACPTGQYQDGRGQSTCSTCPHGTSTSLPAATHRNNCTESPAPSTTVTVTLIYTLLVVCTDDQAREVSTHLFTQVQRLDVDGVCVDLACSNVHVTAWCESYTAYVINSEIRFDNLPTELSTPNISLVPPEELLLQTAIHTNIFDHLQIPGTVLQKNKIATSSRQTCPPGFVLSENICVHADDYLTHHLGVIFGCVVAVVVVIILSVVLYKLRGKSNILVSLGHSAVMEKEYGILNPGYENLEMREVGGQKAPGTPQANEEQELYDIIPEDGCPLST